MTYEAFINQVEKEVDEPNAWPQAANVTDEQVRLSHRAALAIATVSPLNSFPDSSFNEQSVNKSTVGDIDQYDLPSDVFRYRPDLGIIRMTVDTVPRDVQASVPYETLRRAATNNFQSTETLFHVNIEARQIYGLNAGDIQVKYLQEFTEPAKADVGSNTSYPLEGTKADRAAHMVAMHILGQEMRDNAAAQFQALLKSNLENTG